MDTLAKIIGDKVVEARKKQNLTQNDLRDFTGLALGTVNNIENGKGNPSLKSYEKIFDILNLTLDVVTRR